MQQPSEESRLDAAMSWTHADGVGQRSHLDKRGLRAHVNRMERSAYRFAVAMAGLLALLSAGMARGLVPSSGGAHGAATMAAAADMEDCGDCGTTEGGKTVLAPCQAPCMPMAALASVGPERSLTGSEARARLRDYGKAGRSLAPDPNPPQLTLIG